MNLLKILIVEDDITISMDLEEQLVEYGYLITATTRNSDKAILEFKRQLPDLVFLDINLKGSKLDGIEIAEALNTIHQVPIIFLTSYSDDTTRERVKKVNPAYYLIKPCSSAQLKVSIGFALANFSQKVIPSIDHSLQSNPAPANFLKGDKDHFFVKHVKQYIRINIDDILWVKADGSAVEIVTEKEKIVSYAGMKGFMKQIASPKLVRVHRSYIVNLSKVTAFDDITLYISYNNEQAEIPVGKTYRQMVFSFFRQLRSE